MQAYFLTYTMVHKFLDDGAPCGVMVIIKGNEHSELSSNPG